MEKADFMRRAIDLSAASDKSDGDEPFGAVIVKDGKIVGEGRNRVGSECDPTAHGEIDAIRNAGKRLGTTDLSGCDLYTSCEPCAMCAAAIWWAGIERVYFAASSADARQAGFGTGSLSEELARPVEQRSTHGEKMLSEEAIFVLNRWMN